MAEQITLDNGNITVVISTLGATMRRVAGKNGKEYLWSGDEKVWAGTAPILFPVCGGMRDDTFHLHGQEYKLQKHGYARFRIFTVEKADSVSAVFLDRSDSETKKSFPFDYELRIRYTLSGSSVRISTEVTNLSAQTMYYSTGAHEGYACRGGVNGYSIVFDGQEDLFATVLNGNLLENRKIKIARATRFLPLSDSYFAVDALVFEKIASRGCELHSDKDGRILRVDFPQSETLLLWTKPGAEYICIEPWNGLPDRVDFRGEINERPGELSVPAGQTGVTEHTVTVF